MRLNNSTINQYSIPYIRIRLMDKDKFLMLIKFIVCRFKSLIVPIVIGRLLSARFGVMFNRNEVSNFIC